MIGRSVFIVDCFDFKIVPSTAGTCLLVGFCSGLVGGADCMLLMCGGCG